MKLLILLSLVAGIYAIIETSIFGFRHDTADLKLICYYDSASGLRKGLGQLLIPDLEIGLQFCTHLVYGYMGIKPDTFSLHEDFDFHKHQFAEITAMKRIYPDLKLLLSIGGDKDIDPGHPNKYMELLEGGRDKQTAFIDSIYSTVHSYGFDGVDLAFQFPKNKPRKVHSTAGLVWKWFKKLFTGDFIVDPISYEHKDQFTDLVSDLSNVLRSDGFLLSLTVLPNVNSTWYFNVPALKDSVDFVNLAAFDFLTPDRNPEEADFTAPLYEYHGENRLPHYNADYQVIYWLENQCPAKKIILGMSTYGRAWKLTSDSGNTGVPVVPYTVGAAEAGAQSHTAGLLSWAEICAKLPNPGNDFLKGADSPLKRVSDSTKRYGTYAYRPANDNGDHGIWISYEDPHSASNKARYVRSLGLGGLSLFELSFDDFRGQCTGLRFPMVMSARYSLLGENYLDKLMRSQFD